MIWYEVTYGAICLLMVIVNAEIIKRNRRIYHSINSAIHGVCWVIIYLCYPTWWNIDFNLLIHIHFEIPHVIVLPFIGRLFFDVLLDLWRGKDLGYVSDNPKSIIDKIEKGVFKKNGYTPKILYLAIILLANIYL